MTYHFRKAKKSEVKELFSIKHDDMIAYHLFHYDNQQLIEQQKLGNLYLLLNHNQVLSGAILLSNIDLWIDHSSSFFLITFISKVNDESFIHIFMQEIEEYSRTVAKEYIRVIIPLQNQSTKEFFENYGYQISHSDNHYLYMQKSLF